MSSLRVRVSPQLHGVGGESSLIELSELCLVINGYAGFTESTFEKNDRKSLKDKVRLDRTFRY